MQPHSTFQEDLWDTSIESYNPQGCGLFIADTFPTQSDGLENHVFRGFPPLAGADFTSTCPFSIVPTQTQLAEIEDVTGVDPDLIEHTQFVQDMRRLSVVDVNSNEICVLRSNKQPKQIVYTLFKPKRYIFSHYNQLLIWSRTRQNRKPPGANNVYGQKGTLKCDICRHRRIRVKKNGGIR